MDDDKPSPSAKRRFYIIAFTVAFVIDYAAAIMRGGDYRPSLIGLAVMITSALFFTYSLLRDR